MSTEESCYTLIGSFGEETPTEQQLKDALEKGACGSARRVVRE